MTGFTKLFGSIVHSTIWREPNHIRLVWITMLALSDKNGEVEASIPGLADAARVSIPGCEEALDKLSSPDKYSRTKDYEGRRIEEMRGGWRLLNHGMYRDMMSKDDQREKAKLRQRLHRKRQRDPILAAILDRDGPVCGLCAESVDPEEAHIDHIKPLALGGGGEVSNLQLAHPVCNFAKRDSYGGKKPLRNPALDPVTVTEVTEKSRPSLHTEAKADTKAEQKQKQPPSPPAAAAMNHSNEPDGSPLSQFYAAIIGFRVFDLFDHVAIAEQIEGERMQTGKSVEAVVNAIGEAASNAEGCEAANDPKTRRELVAMLKGFCRKARNPTPPGETAHVETTEDANREAKRIRRGITDQERASQGAAPMSKVDYVSAAKNAQAGLQTRAKG